MLRIHRGWQAGAAIALLFSVTAVQTGFAAEARVLVSEVSDQRSTKDFFAKCELELIVMGPEVSQSLGIRDVRINYAADDKGRILNQTSKQSHFQFNEERDHKLARKVSIKNPARDAKYLQFLKGEMELFQPDPKNGSQATIKGFMAKPGKPLSHPALSHSRVQVSFTTKELYQEQKKREMEMAQKNSMDQFGEQLGEAFGKMFEGMFAGMMPDEKNSLHFLVHDPKKRLVAFEFLDADGNRIKPVYSSTGGEFRSYGFKEPPAADMQLVVYLATPESLKVIPFSLSKVALP